MDWQSSKQDEVLERLKPMRFMEFRNCRRKSAGQCMGKTN